VNLPPLLNFFYKGISPFLDPVTRDKVGRLDFPALIGGTESTDLDAFQPGPVRVNSKGALGRQFWW